MSQRHASLRPPRLCSPLCLPPRQSGLGWHVPATRVTSASAALFTTLPASAAKWSRLACPSDTRLFGLRGSVHSASAAKWSRLSLAARLSAEMWRRATAGIRRDGAAVAVTSDTRHRRRQRRQLGRGASVVPRWRRSAGRRQTPAGGSVLRQPIRANNCRNTFHTYINGTHT